MELPIDQSVFLEAKRQEPRKRSRFVYRIMMAASLLTVAGLGVLAFVSASVAERTLDQDARSESRLMGQGAADRITAWLEARRRLLEALADGIELTGAAESEASLRQLLHAKTLTDTFYPVHFGLPDGVHIREPNLQMPVGYDPRTRGWYQAAAVEKQTIVTKPFVSAAADGSLGITIARAVQGPNGVAGVAGGNVELSAIRDFLRGLPLEGKGYAFLVDSEGTVLVHPEQQKVLKPLDGGFDPGAADGAMRETSGAGSGRLAGFFPISSVPSARWFVGISLDRGKVLEPVHAFRRMLVLVVVITVLVLVLCLGLIISRLVARPIAAISSSMRELAKGNLDAEVPAQGRSDEIGEMADALVIFRHSMVENARLAAEQNSLKARAEQEKVQAMNQLADAFEATVGNVISSVSEEAGQIELRAREMAAAASKTGSLTGAVNNVTKETAINVQSVAAATEALSSAIGEISRQVHLSSSTADQAVSAANRTNEKVSGLLSAVGRIGAVVDLISSIANQTDLLALNATIESARAGELGKGFAVVATEVKALAGQTARATEEIASQVQGIQSVTDEAAHELRKVSEIIATISSYSALIASAVEEQGAATQEISRNIQQAAAGTSKVSSNITVVNEAAMRGDAVANDVLHAARQLTTQAGVLDGEVRRFIGSVRAT
ncbi:HAMP domain-containing protein [Bradyrhizobium sp. 149]|uniref:methyl-accepting chemotaxis protein n=1 Tax=Bradyrhizobium sp. 149 TaxID=2782624 RepID=UPI001FF9FD33|nr:methyl-accepting chemotaxis protein [Bradyrhizobium sp. 149]MCK1655323.1 HAMP domain-containing protein [Bradyrhizobium sp. 149]